MSLLLFNSQYNVVYHYTITVIPPDILNDALFIYPGDERREPVIHNAAYMKQIASIALCHHSLVYS